MKLYSISSGKHSPTTLIAGKNRVEVLQKFEKHFAGRDEEVRALIQGDLKDLGVQGFLEGHINHITWGVWRLQEVNLPKEYK